MLNVAPHQGNTNQNHTEISPHAGQGGQNEQIRRLKMLARLRRNGNPLALLVRMQIGAAAQENSVEVPQKIKNRTTLQPSHSTTGNLPQRMQEC